MATINTTTINGVPEVETELTGDENILIQQAPNSNIMGKRTLNNLKSFFGATSNSGGSSNTTSLESSSQNDILYISGGEYATEEIFTKLYNSNNEVIGNSFTEEAFTSIYKTKTTEQLYIHFICDESNINNKLGATIEIQTRLNKNKNGDADWVPICKTSASQKSICSHIIIEGGLEIRGRIFIGTAQTLSINSTDVISLSITSMANDSFGKYDETKCIYTSIEKNNRHCDFGVITNEHGDKKPVYLLDIYAKGGVAKAMSLSTFITIDGNEMKYGRIINYPTTPINQHLGTYLFDKDCRVNVDYSGTLQPGGYIEVKYQTDSDTVTENEKLPTIQQFDDNIYNLSSSMKIEATGTFNFDNITTNNNQISVVTEYEGNPQKIYAILDSSIMMDDTPGTKTIYIYDDIKSCKLMTYGNNINKLRFNKSIQSIPDEFMHKNVNNLTELDLNSNTLTTIGNKAFATYKQTQQKLSKIDIPASVTSIGEYAFGETYNSATYGYKNIQLISIPYKTTLGTNCFRYLAFAIKNINVTHENIHLKLEEEMYTDENGNVSEYTLNGNIINSATAKDKLIDLRTKIATDLPDIVDMLLCDKEGKPLIYILEGKETHLCVSVPKTTANNLGLRKLAVQ